jgi:hypothetical protein
MAGHSQIRRMLRPKQAPSISLGPRAPSFAMAGLQGLVISVSKAFALVFQLGLVTVVLVVHGFAR